MILDIIKCIGLVFGGAIAMSLIGVSALLLGEHLLDKWRKKK